MVRSAGHARSAGQHSFTGCHHSCAQHYIGDIGLIAARVSINDEGDTVDGYHIVAGGRLWR